MIRIVEVNPAEDGSSALASYVIERLPPRYPLTPKDLLWLDVCDDYLEGSPSHESVLSATIQSTDVHGCNLHIDPFELLIDAGICDPKLQLKS